MVWAFEVGLYGLSVRVRVCLVVLVWCLSWWVVGKKTAQPIKG